MRSWLMLVLLLAMCLPQTALAAVQMPPAAEIVDAAVFYIYGQQATFQARVQSDATWQEVDLFLQPLGYPARVEKLSPAKDGGIVYTYDLAAKPLPAFTPVKYWYRVVTTGGQETLSEPLEFTYDDNRFEWEKLVAGRFEIHWYGRDITFGQEILNTAEQGSKRVQTYLPNDDSQPVRIFVYSNIQDFQQALQLSTSTWAVGHASPALRTIVVSAPPGPEELLELERQVPHELAHLAQYARAGDGYAQIPTWLLEGIASQAELYPNPDYASVLENAAQNETLIPLAQLCGQFPREASGAFLAYAESASFVRFLHQKYGTSGLGALIQAYADGVGCQEGPQRAWNISLNELEYRWQQESLGMDMASLIFNNLLPYLALFALLVLLPLLLALPAIRRGQSQGAGG